MAIESLKELLAPITEEEFFEKYWNKRSLHIPGSPEKVDGLFSWNEINRVMSEHRLEAPQIRLSHQGKSTDDLLFLRHRVTERGTRIPKVDIPVLYDLLRDGASLVIDGVDEMSPSVREFCDLIGRDLGCHLSVNSYATWRDVPGFGAHWDDHDLFIVQIAGKKNWRVYGTTRLYPLHRDTAKTPAPEDPDHPDWEVDISPGDVIYLPRGHWHDARGLNEATLHLTCGMNNPLGVDLLDWISDKMRKHIVTRSDIPRFSSEEEITSWSAELKRCLRNEISGNIVEDYLRYWKGNSDARPHASLPYGGNNKILPAEETAKVRFSGITYSGPHRTSEESVTIEALGKQVEVAVQAEPLLTLVLDGEPHTVSALIEHTSMDSGATKKILEVLLRHGILYLTP